MSNGTLARATEIAKAIVERRSEFMREDYAPDDDSDWKEVLDETALEKIIVQEISR